MKSTVLRAKHYYHAELIEHPQAKHHIWEQLRRDASMQLIRHILSVPNPVTVTIEEQVRYPELENPEITNTMPTAHPDDRIFIIQMTITPVQFEHLIISKVDEMEYTYQSVRSWVKRIIQQIKGLK
jgi:hypothetical protein